MQELTLPQPGCPRVDQKAPLIINMAQGEQDSLSCDHSRVGPSQISLSNASVVSSRVPSLHIGQLNDSTINKVAATQPCTKTHLSSIIQNMIGVIGAH